VVARRNNFAEPILAFLEAAYKDFAELTGRSYGLISQYKTGDAETVFVSLGSAAENIEAAVDYLRQTRGASVGSIHINVIRPFPEAAIVNALKGKKNVIILERTDEALSPDNPLGKTFAPHCEGDQDRRPACSRGVAVDRLSDVRGSSAEPTVWARAIFVPNTLSAPTSLPQLAARAKTARQRPTEFRSSCWASTPYSVVATRRLRCCPRARLRCVPLYRWMGRDYDGQESGRDPGRLERSDL